MGNIYYTILDPQQEGRDPTKNYRANELGLTTSPTKENYVPKFATRANNSTQPKKMKACVLISHIAILRREESGKALSHRILTLTHGLLNSLL